MSSHSRKPKVVVTNDGYRQNSYYAPSSSSGGSQHSSGYSGSPPNAGHLGGPDAWTQHGRFVPPRTYEADLPSLSATQRARLVEQQQHASRAFVETGVYHGGLPSGGPSPNPRGYETVERGAAVVHNRGEQFVDGRPVDLGPAFGTGLEHTPGCRLHTRNSAYQHTCFCEPRRTS
jgi:hypothetical protein